MNDAEFMSFQEDIYKQCLNISRNKGSDYATTEDPFSNFKMAAAMIDRPVWEGMLTRMSGKLQRVAILLKKREMNVGPAIKDESIQDTLLDSIVYTAILITWLYAEKEETL